MNDDRKDLPPANSPKFNERVREALSTYLGNRGDRLDRGLTLRDLVESNIIKLRAGFLATGSGNPIAGPGGALGGNAAYEPDLTPPPVPTGFVATATISNIIIEHDAPLYPQGHGHAKTVVYGATWTSGPLPTFSDAVKLTEFTGTVFAHPTNPSTTWHLWIKWVTVDEVESPAPAGGTNGFVVTTGLDVSAMVAAMTGPGNPFTILAVDTIINGVTYPAGTYTTKALIFDAQISNAKIANLAVDDAKIASLSVAKLIAGSIAVGQHIQGTGYVAGSAGWRINGDGTAEFNNVAVRGGIYATYGRIGGIAIDTTGIQSTNYNALGAGWRITSAGDIHLPAGSVTAQALNVGTGTNILNNAGFAHGTSGWMLDYQGDAGVTMGVNNPGWHPVGGDALYIYQPNDHFNGHTDKYQGIYSTQVPAQAGKRYEYSILTGAHRCKVHMFITFHDVSGAYLQYGWCTSENDEATGGGQALQGYKLLSGFVTAPPGTVAVRMWVRKTPTKPGYADSWMFVTRAFIGECGASQTIPSPWSLGGSGTKITGAGITTPSLSALSATLGDVSAGSVRGGAYAGYGWPAAGVGGGFYLGPSGLLMGSANDGRYVQITSAGNFNAPGMNINDGVLTISQLNVIKTANIAGNAVTTSASAKTAAGVFTVSVNLWVPAGEYMDISGIASTSSGPYNQTGHPGRVTAFIDGVAVGSVSSGITEVPGGTSDEWFPNGATAAGAARVYGEAGRTVVIKAQGTGVATTIIAIGTLR